MTKSFIRSLALIGLLLVSVLTTVSAQTYVTTVTSGKYYRIYGYVYTAGDTRVMTESQGTHAVVCATPTADDYAQVWQLTVSDDNQIALKNVLTGRWINAKGGSPFYTTTTESTFNLGSSDQNFTFTIPGTGNGLHHQNNGHTVVSWSNTAGASQWQLEETTVDASKLAAQQTEYNGIASLRDNAATITTSLTKYFTDATCTTLQSAYTGMSDEAFQSAMTADGLPAQVIAMALKVKNNTWTVYDASWSKTEKTFRVADYKAYGAASRWGSLIGASYAISHLSNPTGIAVKENEIVTLYVGAIPAGQSVKLELVQRYSGSGTQYALQAGFNAVKVEADGNLFITYEVDNTTGGKAPFTRIDSYAAVPVHIEGGVVNGYFDLTHGDTNADWAMMQQYLFKGYDYLQLKTDNLLFNMNADSVMHACPEMMVELLGAWDKILDMQHRVMGLEDYDGYFNNLLIAASFSPSSSNYMFGGNYGTYYNEYTLPNIMNYQNMASGAAIWGPAHENGHVHQRAINMVGQSEVSNNLFSNIAIYENGHMTSRAAYISTTFENMAAGKFWIDRDIWERTHMYFQLYQFFQLQGYKKDFYPDLFRNLRGDMIPRSGNAFSPASSDYLKFYVKACEVSGYDLTEFFQAYGFFVVPELKSYTLSGTTQDAYYCEDYGNFYLTITQEMIDEAKAKVAALKLPKANVIFIEDRVSAPAATYEGAAPDEVKTAFSGYPIGKGDVGQYTDFVPSQAASGYFASYTSNADGSADVTINHAEATGAVGFKVYDAQGNLVYLSNTYDFTLPASIYAGLKGTAFKIEAAGADGNDQVMPAGEHYVQWIVKDAQGETLATQRTTQFVGDFVADVPAAVQAPFVTLSAFEAFDYSEPQTVTLTATVTTPFEASHAGDITYYYIKVRNGYLAQSADASSAVTLTAAKQETDAYQWAFYGNPYTGYVLRNKATGDALYAGTNYGGGQHPVASATDSTAWTIAAWSGDAKQFMLQVPGANAYLNDYGGHGTNIAYYGSGSQIAVEQASKVTGITAVPSAAAVSSDSPRYNMAGQRVSKHYKGLVIQSGKKTIKK